MKNKLSFKLKFLLSGSLITTSSLTLLTAAACGSTDPDQQNKLTVYDSLLTSVNKFYKDTYKDYEKNHDNSGFIAFFNDKANNYANKAHFLYNVSTMIYPDASLNSFLIKEIQKNKNFFDATSNWNPNNFTSVISNALLNYFSIFYLTAFSYVHEFVKAKNDINSSATLGDSSAICSYLTYLHKNNLIAASDYSFWILQIHDVFNNETNSNAFLKTAITSGFTSFSVQLPTPGSSVEPNADFNYYFYFQTPDAYGKINLDCVYQNNQLTNKNMQFSILNNSAAPSKSNLPISSKNQIAAANIWKDWKTYQAANPSKKFVDYLSSTAGDTTLTNQAQSLFATDSKTFADFQAKITTQIKDAKNFRFTSSPAWNDTQKGYLATGLVNQLVNWAKISVIMSMCYLYIDPQETINAASIKGFLPPSIYGSFFYYLLSNGQEFQTTQTAGKVAFADSNLSTLFHKNLITIFKSNDYSSLSKTNFLFFLLVNNNLQDVYASSSSVITQKYADKTTITNFPFTLAFTSTNSSANPIIKINYDSQINLTTSAVSLSLLNNFNTIV